MEKNMQNDMETLDPFKGVYIGVILGIMEKNVEDIGKSNGNWHCQLHSCEVRARTSGAGVRKSDAVRGRAAQSKFQASGPGSYVVAGTLLHLT